MAEVLQPEFRPEPALSRMQQAVRPEDILTAAEVARRLKVRKSWIFEQTRNRAKIRNKTPLPYHRIGKYLRFYWPEVSQWLMQNTS